MASCCDDSILDVVDGHVHFAADVEPHNRIQVKQDSDNFHVHLGFLQTKHKYEIKFDVPNLFGFGGKISATNKSSRNFEQFELDVTDIQPSDSNMLNIVLHLTVFKEGLRKISFTLPSDDKEFDVILHARVLGKHSGTPMLKDGIHCLQVIKR